MYVGHFVPVDDPYRQLFKTAEAKDPVACMVECDVPIVCTDALEYEFEGRAGSKLTFFTRLVRVRARPFSVALVRRLFHDDPSITPLYRVPGATYEDFAECNPHGVKRTPEALIWRNVNSYVMLWRLTGCWRQWPDAVLHERNVHALMGAGVPLRPEVAGRALELSAADLNDVRLFRTFWHATAAGASHFSEEVLNAYAVAFAGGVSKADLLRSLVEHGLLTGGPRGIALAWCAALASEFYAWLAARPAAERGEEKRARLADARDEALRDEATSFFHCENAEGYLERLDASVARWPAYGKAVVVPHCEHVSARKFLDWARALPAGAHVQFIGNTFCGNDARMLELDLPLTAMRPAPDLPRVEGVVYAEWTHGPDKKRGPTKELAAVGPKTAGVLLLRAAKTKDREGEMRDFFRQHGEKRALFVFTYEDAYEQSFYRRNGPRAAQQFWNPVTNKVFRREWKAGKKGGVTWMRSEDGVLVAAPEGVVPLTVVRERVMPHLSAAAFDVVVLFCHAAAPRTWAHEALRLGAKGVTVFYGLDDL